VGGDECAHQTHEALLWHTQYLDFLSDFMLVEEGRCVGGGAGAVAVLCAVLFFLCRAVCPALHLSLSLAFSLSLAPSLARRALSSIYVFFCEV
jgi:membrane-associated PAP2 superfamily phosphatase